MEVFDLDHVFTMNVLQDASETLTVNATRWHALASRVLRDPAETGKRESS